MNELQRSAALDVDDLGELFCEEWEPALTAADALRDGYLAWREERGMEPPFAFTWLAQRFQWQMDCGDGFPALEGGSRWGEGGRGAGRWRGWR